MQEQKRILVIDSEPDNLYSARDLLNAEGYEVLTHPSPFGIPGLIRTAAPDLVLIGVNTPFFPGVDLAAYLWSDDRTRAIPIVLYTSDDERTLMSTVATYRLSGYIRKGDGSELRRKVAFFLGSHLVDAPAFRKQLYAVE